MNCKKCGTPLPSASNSCSVCGCISLTGDYGTPQAQEPLKVIIENITAILISPKDFFMRIREQSKKSTSQALVFALFCAGIAISAELLWSYLIPTDHTHLSPIAQQSPLRWSNLIYSPLTLLFKLFFLALFVYGMAAVFRIKRGNFAQSLQLCAYCQVAFLFTLIPVAGEFVSTVLWVVLFVIGISTVYRISVGKTVLIIFSPVMVLLFIALILFSLTLFSGFSTHSLFEHLLRFSQTALDFMPE